MFYFDTTYLWFINYCECKDFFWAVYTFKYINIKV